MWKNFLIIFCVIVFFAINFVGNGQDKGSSWVNVQYVECMKNKLPCECGKMGKTNIFLSIDTNNNSKNYGIVLNKYGQMEPFVYPIKKIKTNEYKIFNWNETILAELFIQNDTLHFISDSIHSQFIKSEMTQQYDIHFYYSENVYLLNKALGVRGYPKLEQIINHDFEVLHCDCNPWLDNVNLLTVEGKSSAWILSIESDSLHIEKVINGDRDPDDPIQVERWNSYKW